MLESPTSMVAVDDGSTDSDAAIETAAATALVTGSRLSLVVDQQLLKLGRRVEAEVERAVGELDAGLIAVAARSQLTLRNRFR